MAANRHLSAAAIETEASGRKNPDRNREKRLTTKSTKGHQVISHVNKQP
jgi:hypothetical protein